MFRTRPRQALCGALLAAAVLAALPAGAARSASAKTKVVRYTIPLPKTHRGKVVLLELRTQLPKNVAVGGSVAVATITNLRNLPCYVRAAQLTVKQNPNFWHVFVAIAAPKGGVECNYPMPPSPARSLELKVAVGPPLSSHPMTIRKLPIDACRLLKVELPRSLNGVELTGIDLDWKPVVKRTIAADPVCR